MSKGKRDPLQVDPLFRIKIIDLQHKLKVRSIRELTEKIAKSDFLDDLEKKLAEISANGDIKINFDRRKK